MFLPMTVPTPSTIFTLFNAQITIEKLLNY